MHTLHGYLMTFPDNLEFGVTIGGGSLSRELGVLEGRLLGAFTQDNSLGQGIGEGNGPM